MVFNYIKITLSVFILFLVLLPAFAQGPPPATPIDGGLGVLLAVGAAYGIKKLQNNKNN